MVTEADTLSPASTTEPATRPEPVIILDESQLDCDIATAIRRVREQAGTSRSQILVIAPEPREEAPGLPQPSLPSSAEQLARLGQQSAVKTLGCRLAPVAATLSRFAGEQRAALEALDAATSDDETSEARRALGEVLEWTDAAVEDLVEQVDAATGGMMPVWTADMLPGVARQVEAAFPRLHVQVTPGEVAACWGRPADVAEALFAAIVLVAHRIGGVGTIRVTSDQDDRAVLHRVAGFGEPTEIAASRTAARFRELVERNGGTVEPGQHGRAGTELVLRLRRVW